ncbi:MAG: AAC(3) family N-acetyltransferase [Lentisphaeria bacterium]|nr:AAC(3) family N-acetyltransferase [Lentisphaeria bacterium]
MHSYSSLKQDLIQLGLLPSDTVLVHSSMKSIGEVENGAETVLDVLMDHFEKTGLLVFPTLSYDIYGKKEKIFSPEKTPSVVGLLTEMFRKRDGVIRSLHPTHSVAAYGKDAVKFCSGHENFSTPCARKSPWGKLYDRNARILFIGTKSISCSTFFHAVEEFLPVPGMFEKDPYDLFLEKPDGSLFRIPSFRHHGHHNKYYSLAAPLLRENGALQEGKFGDAACFLLDARKSADLILALLKKTPLFFTEEYQEKAGKNFLS